MESEGSDIDDLADLDLATFAQPGSNSSPQRNTRGSGNLQTVPNGNDDSFNDQEQFIPQDQDSFFSVDHNISNDARSQNNVLRPQNSNPFYARNSPTTNPFHSDIANTNPFSSPGNPFAADIAATQKDSSHLSGSMINSDDQLFQGETQASEEPAHTEYVYLNRLPGENLGMVLGIEGDQENRQPVDAVLVKSVTPGGAAARACEGNNKILVGDEIIEIDGRPLKELTHDQCIEVFQEMPDNVVLTISRKRNNRGDELIATTSSASSSAPVAPAKRKAPPVPPPRKYFKQSSADISGDTESDSCQPRSGDDHSELDTKHSYLDEEKVPRGFVKLDLTIFRGEEDSLGLSIVPSYGATCDLYQIKRLLPTGACAQSGQLEIGDRLLSCNGLSLKGLTQSQCLNVLKTSGNLVELAVYRHIDDQGALTGDEVDEEDLQAQSERIEQAHQVVETQCEGDISQENRNQRAGDEDPGKDSDATKANVPLIDFDTEELYEGNSGASAIPPPIEFSDIRGIDEIEYQPETHEPVTNIDDLLFGVTSETSLNDSENSGNNLTKDSPSEVDTENQYSLLNFDEPALENNPDFSSLREPTLDFLDSGYSPRSLEEFAEECFNNIGNDDNVYAEKQNNDDHQANVLSESVDVDQILPDTSSPGSEAHITLVNVSPTSSEPTHITKIPVSSVSSTETSYISAKDVSPVKIDGQPHTTSISVNTTVSANVTHIDVVPNKKSSHQPSPPREKSSKSSGGVVFYTNAGSVSPTSPSATIKIDGLAPKTPAMSVNSENAVVHTTIGVASTKQSGEEEDVILPMVVAKDSQGKPLCLPSDKPATGQQSEVRKIDEEAKQEIANVLAAIGTETLKGTSCQPVQNGLDEEVSEQEIVPTVLSHDQQQVVLGVLSNWGNIENPKKPSVFQKAVSGLIDFQRDESGKPSNALAHTTLGVTNSGQEEDIIQPMAVAKDHQGKPLCVPSPQPERKNPEVTRVIDEDAKQELTNVLASISSPLPPRSSSEPAETGSEISEQEIVPVVLSHDQKEVVMNALNSWANFDSPKKPSIFQRAVAGFKSLKDDDSEAEEADEKGNSLSQPKPEAVEETVVQAASVVSVESTPKKVLSAVSSFEKSAAESAEDHVPVRTQPEAIADVRGKLDYFTKSIAEASPTQPSEQVVLRHKSKQTTDFRAKIDSFQYPQDAGSSSPSTSVSVGSRRPVSMIEVSSSSSSGSGKFDDIRKSFTTESKAPPALRQLSAIRPLSASTSNTHRVGTSGFLGRPSSGNFSSSTFTSRANKADYPKSRQEDGSQFQVDVLKGIVGLGLKVKVTPDGHTQVTEIQKGGPIDKNGNMRVGDYLTSINSTELSGLTDARVQQVLRLLPRGLAKLVVTSAAPAGASKSEPHQPSSQFGVRLSPKPFPVDNQQAAPTSTTQTFLATENGIEPYPSEDKDASSTDLQLPIFTTSDSTLTSSQPPLTARIEITSSNQQNSGPVKIAIKPTPTPRPGQEILRPKALPRHGYSSANESWETSSEDSTPREVKSNKGQTTMDSEVVAAQKKPAGRADVLNSPGHQSAFQNSRAMFEQKAATKPAPAVLPKPRILPVPSSESSQKAVEVSPAKSPPEPEQVKEEIEDSKLQSPEAEAATSSEPPVQEPPVADTPTSPQQKVPPPVAPKPRLSSTSSNKSEDSVDGAEQNVKPAPKISAGYERLQAISKGTKPSKIIEKSRTFVSSTAKMFDNKPPETETSTNQNVTHRRISLGVVAPSDGTKSINTSLMPVKERRKSTGTAQPGSVSLSQPTSLPSSSLSKPKTLAFTAKRPTEITIPETSPREEESGDGKTKTVMSPTRLNAALSPRRKSSADSPISPPYSYAPKISPRAKDAERSFDGTSHSDQASAEQSGIFKSTPVTMQENKSLSPTSPPHERVTSPRSDTKSQMLTREQRSKSFPAPTPSPSSPLKSPSSASKLQSQLSEEALEDTMKKFDDLLMDAPYTRTETDPNDLLLWAPVRKDRPSTVGSVSPRTADENQIVVELTPVEVKRPVASPRAKPEVKADSVSKEEKKAETESDAAKQEEVVEKEKVLLVQETPAKSTNIENIVNSENNKEDNENIVALKVSQEIMNQSPAKAPTVESLLTNGSPAGEAENIVAVNLFEQVIRHDQKSCEDLEANAENQDAVTENGEVQESLMVVSQEAQTNSKPPAENDQESLEQEIERKEKVISQEDKKHEIFRAKAAEIVDDVMAKVISDPNLHKQIQPPTVTDEPLSPASSDDEPPPLPGAPPPPLIFRDTKLLVNAGDLIDQGGSPVVPESTVEQHPSDSHSTAEPPEAPESMELQVNVNSGGLIVLDKSEIFEEDHASRADSADPLNSTGDSYADGEALRGHSPNSVDMLSEDSGMPADEDQEVATDDAISPPGEFAETLSGADTTKNVPFSSQFDMQISSSVAPQQQSVNLVIKTSAQTESKVLIEQESQPSAELSDNKAQSESVENVVNDVSEDSEAPSLPTSTPPAFTAEHASTDHPQELSVPVSSDSPKQVSDSQPLLLEITSPGENISMEKEQIPETSVEDSKSESQDEVNEVSEENQVANDISGDEVTSPDVQEETISEVVDKQSVSAKSKRRWCLRSNKCPEPLLQGESDVPVPVDYKEDTLINALSFDDLVSHLAKANSVLDAVSAPPDMDLVLIHLHRDGDSVPLGMDVKQKGGSRFEVSNIQEGSPVWKEGGAQVGDWLVGLDNLWADNVTVMRFMGRLTKPKHDSLLVLARGEKAHTVPDVEPSRPVPAPRPRSGQKVEADVMTETSQQPTKTSATTVPTEESASEQGKQLSPTLPIAAAPPVPAEPAPAADDGPPLPDNPPPLPTEAPPAPITTPPQAATEPSAPEAAQPSLRKTPPPVQKKPSHPTATPLSEEPSTIQPAAPEKAAPVPQPKTKSSAPAQKEPSVISAASMKDTSVSSQQPEAETKASPVTQSQDALGAGVHTVIMMKGATGVGFCLEGGVGSPRGNLPITIKRIFKGGPAEKCGQLKVKDEILNVNGVDFTAMRHYEAWNHLKFLDDGEVHIKIRRM